MYLIHGTSIKLDAGDTKMNKIPAREESVSKYCQEWEAGGGGGDGETAFPGERVLTSPLENGTRVIFVALFSMAGIKTRA